MKISKIFLYDEPSIPEIKIKHLADFIRNKFKIDTEVRKNIFSDIQKTTAKQLASCRITNGIKPFEIHSPTEKEIEYEENNFQSLSKTNNIIMYDGFEFQKVLQNIVSKEEKTMEYFHLIFTNKLMCTYNYNDYRYHGRAIICSNPSIISITGIIEAPAKPKEYYIDLISNITHGLNLELIKKKYRGKYLEYNDKRLSSIVEGYSMQALFYYLTGDPFCNQKECRLFNPHWQKELLYSQIEIGKLCKKHQKILEDLVLDLNS
ncbi:MAG TPA: DUF6775 family putative metallopeptidase [Nitrosopumilaceae archaeon]|nr:DUF6775 family putative metallopeptidase [Nitrosopumilaceae archaeon]